MANGFLLSVNSGFELAKNSIKKQFRENLFGYLWVFFVPFIYAFCFLIVKQSINAGQNIDVYQQHLSIFRAFVGMSFIQLWIQLLQDTSQLIKKRKNFLRSLTITLDPFFYSILFEVIIALVVRMALMYGAAIYFGFAIPTNFLGHLVLFGCSFLILGSALFIGMLIVPWASLFGDFKRLISSSVMPIALLSPIFYEPVVNAASPLYWLNIINPIAVSTTIFCDVFSSHEYLYSNSFFVWILLPLIFFFPLLRLLNKQLPIILERLG